MKTVACVTATAPDKPLEKSTIDRRELRADDVMIEIEYSGVCHSDIHAVRNEWGKTKFPLVTGHEIVGRVVDTGPAATRFAIGDRVGVGCMVDSCGECDQCAAGEQQNCREGRTQTYNGTDRIDGSTTQGGYATHIPVKESFALRIPEALNPAQAAPLLCAGITTYSPLVRWGAGPGKKVAVVGMGGLGHVGLKIAAALGARVTVISQTRAKEDDARRFGATEVIAAGDDPDSLAEHAGQFDIVLVTISAQFDPQEYTRLLTPRGVLVLVGLPPAPLPVQASSITNGGKVIAGSNIGGIAETQEMLDFCAEHGVGAEVEVIGADQINKAHDRVVASDVRYRFVIDAKTF